MSCHVQSMVHCVGGAVPPVGTCIYFRNGGQNNWNLSRNPWRNSCSCSLQKTEGVALRQRADHSRTRRKAFLTSAVVEPLGKDGSDVALLAERKTSLPLSGQLAPPQWVIDAVAEQPWKGGLEPTAEGSYTVDPSLIQGTIPEELRGCLYVNGPGRTRIGARKYGHWFDGDGMAHSIWLDGPEGEVQMTSRFVRTEKFEKQERAGSNRIATYGIRTRADRGLLDGLGIPGNPVNTSMMSFGGKVYALCEAGPPMNVDPETLETLGFADFKGPGGISLGKLGFSAHYKIDPDTEVLYNSGFEQSDFSTGVFAISPSGELLKKSFFRNDKLKIAHDFGMSKNHIIFFSPPYEFENAVLLKVALGLTTCSDESKWVEGKGTRVVIMSRDDLSIKLDTTVAAFSTYHFVNAFEDDGKLHVLFCRLKGPREVLESYFGDMYASNWQPEGYHEAWEIVWNLDTWQIVAEGPAFKPARGNPSPFGMEFPVINPKYIGKRNRYMYVNASSGASALTNGGQTAHQMDSMQKYDLQTGELTSRRFPQFHYPSGDATFVHKANAISEDDGYLILNVYNPSRHGTDVYVLDAADIEGTPVCKLSLPTHIPLHFHGCWAPQRRVTSEV